MARAADATPGGVARESLAAHEVRRCAVATGVAIAETLRVVAAEHGSAVGSDDVRHRDRAFYMPHVDGLRAIAIATVVAFHAWPSLLPGGFIGVDVFFVISGFLITRLILAEIQAGTFSLPVFFARRIRRLLPAATVAIVAVLAVGAVLLLPETYRETGRSVVAASLMFANLLFYRTADYFSAPADEKPLLHTWSLSVEDQFYLTWPLLLLLLAPRIPRAGLIALAATLLALSLGHAESMLARNPDYAFYMLPARAWELLAGCLLALVAGNLAPRRLKADGLAALGLAQDLASATLLGPTSHFPGVAAAPAVAGTMLAIAAGLGGGNAAQSPLLVRFLSTRPLVLAGLVSYSLYLWHWPILSLGQYAAGRHLTAIETAVAVALSLLAAVLSWRYVERPFRLHGPMPLRAALRTIAIGAATMTALAIVGGSIRALDGLPQRFDGIAGKLFEEIANGNPLRHSCDGTDRITGTDAKCNVGRRKAAGESYDVAVFGDSNADHLMPMVTRWAETEQLAARQVTKSACAPLLGVDTATRSARQNQICKSYQKAIIRFVEANPGLKVVVLSGVWPGYTSGLVRNGLAVSGRMSSPGVAFPAPDKGQASAAVTFSDALAGTVAFFRSRGIRVHLIGPIPHFRVLASRCVVKALSAGSDVAACGRATSEVADVAGPAERVIEAIAAADPGVSFVLPTRVMCGSQWCSPMKDGVFLYRDALHLNSSGSRLLYDYFSFPKRP